MREHPTAPVWKRKIWIRSRLLALALFRSDGVTGRRYDRFYTLWVLALVPSGMVAVGTCPRGFHFSQTDRDNCIIMGWLFITMYREPFRQPATDQ